MALLLARNVQRVLNRSLSVTSSRLAKNELFPDPMEHATGIEKKELLALKAGNEDPFFNQARKRLAVSTRQNPNLVPSYEDSRIMGCICEEDATAVMYMTIHKNEPKRCECGHWFLMTEAKPL